MMYAKFEVDFSPLLNCYIQKWMLGYDLSEPHLFFTSIATTPTLVLELYARRFAPKFEKIITKL